MTGGHATAFVEFEHPGKAMDELIYPGATPREPPSSLDKGSCALARVSCTIRAMNPRAGLLTIILALVPLGCPGEFSLDEVSGDSDGTGTGTGDGDGDNLLGNPSFEVWSDQQLVIWSSNDTLSQSDLAVDGDFSLIVDAPTYSAVNQTLQFTPPLPAGTCLVGMATIRWITGSGVAPGFVVTATYTDKSEEQLGDPMSWIADGDWHESQIAAFTLAQDTETFAVSLGNATADPQTYGIDAVSLRVVDCP